MSLEVKDEIWVLSDGRPGTFSQGVGLAEAIGVQCKIIEISYSFLTALPNVFFSQSLLRASLKTREEFKKLHYLPKIIISCGRKTAPIGLYLKNLVTPSPVRLIQIMHPNINFKKFDYVILPKHDKIYDKKFDNLLTTLGAITKINDKSIDEACVKYSSWFSKIKKPKIALFIGGSSNKTKFEKDSAVKLANLASSVAKKMDAVLLLLNSRRTDEGLLEEMEKNLECDYKIYDWKKLQKDNPYLAIIGFADFFIVTGDSVSMISECASTGKPVYIFDDGNISSKKHRIFHKDMYRENHAKNFSDDVEILENFSSKKLQEAKRIANIIKNNIL